MFLSVLQVVKAVSGNEQKSMNIPENRARFGHFLFDHVSTDNCISQASDK